MNSPTSAFTAPRGVALLTARAVTLSAVSRFGLSFGIVFRSLFIDFHFSGEGWSLRCASFSFRFLVLDAIVGRKRRVFQAS